MSSQPRWRSWRRSIRSTGRLGSAMRTPFLFSFLSTPSTFWSWADLRSRITGQSHGVWSTEVPSQGRSPSRDLRTESEVGEFFFNLRAKFWSQVKRKMANCVVWWRDNKYDFSNFVVILCFEFKCILVKCPLRFLSKIWGKFNAMAGLASHKSASGLYFRSRRLVSCSLSSNPGDAADIICSSIGVFLVVLVFYLMCSTNLTVYRTDRCTGDVRIPGFCLTTFYGH